MPYNYKSSPTYQYLMSLPPETDPWRIEMINLIGDEVERLQRTSGCSLKYRDYLQATYGTRFYNELGNADLKKFRKHLKSLKVEELIGTEGENCIRLVPRRKKTG